MSMYVTVSAEDFITKFPEFTGNEYIDVMLERSQNYITTLNEGLLVDGARQLVIRQKGGDYLLPDDIPELLDPELPQQLLVSALRRYRR